MSSILKWARNASSIRSHNKERHEITDSPVKPLTKSEQLALSCQCHPDLEQDRPHVLCEQCQRFVNNCHWIKIHKLPTGERLKLSQRQWRRGAQTMDGDVARRLVWDYKHTIQSKECHLCQLLWSILDPEAVLFDLSHGTPVHLTVYSDPSFEDLARLQVCRDSPGDTDTGGLLKLYHKSVSIENTDAFNLGLKACDGPSAIDEKMLTRIGKCTGSNANHGLAKVCPNQFCHYSSRFVFT